MNRRERFSANVERAMGREDRMRSLLGGKKTR